MPRYFFNIVLPDHVITDYRGRKLAGLEAAHWHAVGLAYQLRLHMPDDEGRWAIRIEDERRCSRELFVPSFRNRARAKKASAPVVGQRRLRDA